MNNVTFDRKKTLSYLFWTFLIAYVLQGVAAFLTLRVSLIAGRLVIAVVMFAPMLGVLLAGEKLPGMGWKPRLKGRVRYLLMAWFLPMLLTAIGAALYFLVFPEHFDLSGEYFLLNVGPEVLEQLEAQGVSYTVYVLINTVAAMTYAPAVNMLLAAGEEAGWRGFLYPQLKAKFGRAKGWLIGGVIWAVWHWPLIWLIGYEYGTEYVGFPIVGMLIFCIFTTSSGIACDWLYEKTRCIWIPSILHGAINAAATIPLGLCIVHTGSAVLLGPAPIGVLAGLPLIVWAAIILFQSGKTAQKDD